VVGTERDAAADGSLGSTKETGEQLMRNLIILGCAVLLALGLSFGSIAGSINDTGDFDGVPNQYDNCDVYPNGPLLTDPSTPLCDGQEDGDLDGYGNPCDYDYNNNGQADLSDLSQQIDNAFSGSTNPVFDNNCNGQADLADLSASIDNSFSGTIPGTSGLACAGTIPCVATSP
jgi:hypothetical protein